jgi:hypothetical protein
MKHAGIAASAVLALAACVPQTFSFEDNATMSGLGVSDAEAADVEPASDATTASSDTQASTTPASNTETSDAEPANDATTASDASAQPDGHRPPPRKEMDSSANAGGGDANPLPDCANDPNCSECSANADCSKGSLPVCDMNSSRCVGCLADSDCPADGRWFCLPGLERCVAACSGDAMSCGRWQCVVDAGLAGYCSDCVSDADCDGHQICNAGGLCVECENNSQCHGGSYCSKNGYCVVQSP